MISIPKGQQNILSIFIQEESLSSSSLHERLIDLGETVSLVTVKRELSDLKSLGLIGSFGAGRSVRYRITAKGRLFTDVDIKKYTSIEPDRRKGLKSYTFDLFKDFPDEIFSLLENQELTDATEVYRKNTSSLSVVLKQKEFERFVIELSWKSSRIEGNTYTLLDTERLIKEGIEAVGHDKNEARMILNHKDAFQFILEHADSFKNINLAKIEEIHKILVKDLSIDLGIRAKGVGVTGSIYRPLDTKYQLQEAIEALCNAVNAVPSAFTKALVALLGLSYIQPFEDGNKRTSRLIANAMLLAHNLAPLSYRSVDEDEYREAILVFYELNSMIPFKKIFLNQYVFSARNYAVM